MTLSSQKRGFTITEVLVVLALTASLLLLFDRILLTGYRFVASLMNGQTEELRVIQTRETITRVLRRVGVSDRGAFPIIHATPNDLAAYTDQNVDDSKERIRIWRDGAILRMAVTHPIGTPPSYDKAASAAIELLSGTNAMTPLFFYFDDHGTDLGAAPDPSAIRRIDVLVSRGMPTDLDRVTVSLPSFEL